MVETLGPGPARQSSTLLMSGDGKRGIATAPVLDSTSQRQEAARAGRYPGSRVACHRDCRRHPGPCWRRHAAGGPVWNVSVPAEAHADGGYQSYQGPEFQKSLKRVLSQAEVQIVKRSDRDKGFVVLPRR